MNLVSYDVGISHCAFAIIKDGHVIRIKNYDTKDSKLTVAQRIIKMSTEEILPYIDDTFIILIEKQSIKLKYVYNIFICLETYFRTKLFEVVIYDPIKKNKYIKSILPEEWYTAISGKYKSKYKVNKKTSECMFKYCIVGIEKLPKYIPFTHKLECCIGIEGCLEEILANKKHDDIADAFIQALAFIQNTV